MALRLGSSTPSKLYIGAVEATKAYLGATEVYSSGPAAWTPADLGASLSLWLDADDASTITLNGSTVSQWGDKSGRAFHLSQATAANQPTYSATGLNSKPTVSTDGGDSLTRGTTTILRNVGQASVAIVIEYAAAATFAVNSHELLISTAAGTLSTRLLIGPNIGSPTNRQGLAGRRLDTDGFQAVVSSTGSVALRGSPFLKVAQADYQNAQANHWTNGTQDMTGAAYHTAGNTSDTNAPAVSMFAGGGPMPAGTKISEMLVIENTLSTADRERVEGYLAWKWGLEANLPVGHPYKSAPPTV